MAEQVDTVAPIVWQEVKGILFDVDGTLVDSDELHFQAFVDLLQELNWEGALSETRLDAHRPLPAPKKSWPTHQSRNFDSLL